MTRRLALVVLAVGVLAWPVQADRPERRQILRAAPPGAIVDAPDGRSEMELVRFDGELLAAAAALAPEETIRVEDWPISPGRRAQVVLRRFDVYAPDARIVVIENGVEREAPRSGQVFLGGRVEEGLETGSRIVSWLDADTGSLGGFAITGTGTFVLVPPEAGHATTRLAPAEALTPEGKAPSWSCGVPDHEEHSFWHSVREHRAARTPPETGRSGVVSALATLSKTAVIAFDTDAEYLSLRFSNNTANAAEYIAQLVAGMSLIYERDVAAAQGDGVRILQGYTILRVGESSDPYSDTTGTADSTKLNEFGNYWDSHYPTTVVRRALAAMLSGRQGSSNSASGIAWVGALCAGSTYGYSFNQLFTGAFGVTADLGILAHEVGHNFGAFHTHNCYYGTPPIDRCVAPEGGCTTATGCPGSQTFNGVTTNGTLMSYCHTLNSGPPNYTPLCTPRALVFHPRSITDNPADPYGIDSVLTEVANASCLASLTGGVVPPAPTISSVSPSTGVLAGGTSLTIAGTNFASGAAVAFIELPSNNVFGTPSSKAAASVTFNSSTQLTVTTPSASSAGAVDVVVMNPDRQTATRASGFTYSVALPAPTVTAISPNFGSTAGGTNVRITGTGFVATPAVSIGGAAATGEAFVSSTTLTATTGARAAGLVNVVVTNPDLQAGTLTSGYYYAAPPTATKWFPLDPCRVIDTRLANGPLGGPVLSAGQTRTFDVTTTAPTCGIPPMARALTVNYTVTGATQPGELRAFAGDALWTGTSIVSFKAGATRANNGHLALSGTGSGTFSLTNASAGTVHFILDVNGYYQ
jgi:hypothetical protein